jgi:hypothetical protein
MKLSRSGNELERILLNRLKSAGYLRAQRPKVSPTEQPGAWEVIVLSLGQYEAVVPRDVKRIIDSVKDEFVLK